jgi:hypothetical protein
MRDIFSLFLLYLFFFFQDSLFQDNSGSGGILMQLVREYYSRLCLYI